MPKIKSELEIRKAAERQIRKDSTDKTIFGGSKLRKIPRFKIEPVKDSFGRHVSYRVEGEVEVDIYSEEKRSYLYPKRGKKAFSWEYSASGEMTKHDWKSSERE